MFPLNHNMKKLSTSKEAMLRSAELTVKPVYMDKPRAILCENTQLLEMPTIKEKNQTGQLNNSSKEITPSTEK